MEYRKAGRGAMDGDAESASSTTGPRALQAAGASRAGYRQRRGCAGGRLGFPVVVLGFPGLFPALRAAE